MSTRIYTQKKDDQGLFITTYARKKESGLQIGIKRGAYQYTEFESRKEVLELIHVLNKWISSPESVTPMLKILRGLKGVSDVTYSKHHDLISIMLSELCLKSTLYDIYMITKGYRITIIDNEGTLIYETNEEEEEDKE